MDEVPLSADARTTRSPSSMRPPVGLEDGGRATKPGPAKLVARYRDGRVVKGYSYDFSADAPRFQLYPLGGESTRQTIEVRMMDLKAVFFVRDFAGNPQYAEQKTFAEGERSPGRPVAVVFTDGEVLTGYTLGYDRQLPRFFLFPVDPRSNNLRVFVVSTAVSAVRG